MTTHKTFKRQVRERAAKTGESFTAARAQLIARADRADRVATAAGATVATPPPIEPTYELPASDQAVAKATGHDWAHWLTILDAWDGTKRRHGEIARHLVEAYGVDGWWSQMITNGFERARGLRAKNQRPGEGFSVSASVTVNVPIERLSAAFLEEAERSAWLPAGSITPRTLRPNKSGTFDWVDPPSRIALGLVAKGTAKSQAAIEHSRLPDAGTVAQLRAFWRTRFADLKARLER